VIGDLKDRRERTRRTTSDQRLAELEALATLVRSRAPVGHGRIDPFLYGKRSRASVMDELQRGGDADDRRHFVSKLMTSSGGDTREPFLEEFMQE